MNIIKKEILMDEDLKQKLEIIFLKKMIEILYLIILIKLIKLIMTLKRLIIYLVPLILLKKN